MKKLLVIVPLGFLLVGCNAAESTPNDAGKELPKATSQGHREKGAVGNNVAAGLQPPAGITPPAGHHMPGSGTVQAPTKSSGN